MGRWLEGFRLAVFVFLIYVATYLALFNWYPFFAFKPLSRELIISSREAVEALVSSIAAWGFVYPSMLYALTASMVRGATLRRVAKSLALGAIPTVAYGGLALALALPFLVSSGRELIELAEGVYRVATMLHLEVVSYLVSYFVVPAFAPIAIVYSFGGLRAVKEMAIEATQGFVLAILVAILVHDFIEPLTDVAVTMALLALGGPQAALPYYRGYDPTALRYLSEAIKSGGTLAPIPWGGFVGAIVFSIIVAKCVQKLLLERKP